MALVKRGSTFHVAVKFRDAPRMRLSTGTGNKALAAAMAASVRRLHTEGRFDLLEMLKAGAVTLRQVHHATVKGPAAVETLRAAGAGSPLIAPLLAEWLDWCESPAGISPRLKRPYAVQTIRRYRVSWAMFLDTLARGRDARLSDVTSGAIADYKRTRIRAQGGTVRTMHPDRPLAVGTINRDLGAIGAFLTWCRDVKGLDVVRPRFNRAKEPQGRERWLDADELRRLERAALEVCPDYWPLFATLVYTGARFGEAAGLRGADVRLAQRRITLNEADRRLKTAASVRDVPIAEPLAAVLAAHLARVAPGPADLVFPLPLSDYHRARDWFAKAAILAGLHDGHPKRPRPSVTIHDLRHTFGVHAAQAGVPIARLQRLLGHATALMTLRYMKHAPEAYFTADAERIAGSMRADAEGEARSRGARAGLRTA